MEKTKIDRNLVNKFKKSLVDVKKGKIRKITKNLIDPLIGDR